MSKDKEETFLESVKRLANIHRERCKTDPVLRASWESSKRKRECSASHDRWNEDYDIHGPLNSYCSRCGVCDLSYQPDANYKESFMTCDEILELKNK
jgi:hypothetical protein